MEASRNSQAVYLRRIHEAYPELEIDAGALRTTSGQFNDALIVNEELIFRFPRSPQSARTLAMEVKLLRELRGRLPLPVPDPIYSGPDPRTGERSFVGYRMIPGEPLYTGTLEAIEDEGAVRAIAYQLASFLRQLHAVPVAALGVELPVADDAAYWRRMQAAFCDELFGHMRPDARDMVTRRFASFLNKPSNFGWRPMLRHGDFGGTNILHDPSSRLVSGVIDFGSATWGDPAVDLAAVSHYGRRFLEAFYPAYPALSSEAVRERGILPEHPRFTASALGISGRRPGRV